MCIRDSDNTDDGDDAADVAEDVTADDTDGAGGDGGVGHLQALIVHAHGARGPNHGDEALEDHHPVEGVGALTLALHGAGDDSGLGGVEAGQDAAGDRDEEDGQEVSADGGKLAKLLNRGSSSAGAAAAEDGAEVGAVVKERAGPGLPGLYQSCLLYTSRSGPA